MRKIIPPNIYPLQDSAVVIATSLSDVGVTSVAPGNGAVFSADLLKNKYDNHIWVDAIRFQLGLNTQQTFAAGAAQVRIHAGRQELTRNWTTLASLCGVQDRLGDMPTAPVNYIGGTSVFGPLGGYGLHTWYLPKPLFLPRGESISIELLNNDIAGSAAPATYDGTTTVGLIGRETLEEPTHIDIPYAAPFNTALITPNATTGTRTSTPAGALGNPYSHPLYVTKLIGAIARNRTSGLGAKWVEFLLTQGSAAPSVNSALTAQIVCSSGGGSQGARNFTARDFVIWNNLFPPQTRELILNTVLPARSSGFVVNLFLGTGIDTAGNYQFQFCLHGYYKAPIGELWSSMVDRAAMHHAGVF